ncbi:hypothetical protein Taro_055687 [Colocasia esculenta]|uniref:Uncharacterized protein n=1 Tax=Colocasia esculenta TaxID=4460 RepID=A0A843XU54_COLES|nr:hypothetical protein [Colocasia esculenta]
MTLHLRSQSSLVFSRRRAFRHSRDSRSNNSGFHPRLRRPSWSTGGELCSRMPAGGQQFVEVAAEEQPRPTPQAALVQPEVPPVVRQQTPVAVAAPEDRTALLERFLHLRPPNFSGDRDPDRAESWVHELERTFEAMDCAEQNQVAVARAMPLEREYHFQPQQSGGSGRSSPYQCPPGSRGSVSSSSSSGTGGAGMTSKLKKLFYRGGGGERHYQQ